MTTPELPISKHEASVKTTKRRTYRFEILLISLISAFSILAILATQNPYFGLDLIVTKSIQNINFPGYESLMLLLTTLGNVEWAILTVILVFLFFVTIRRNFNAVFFLIAVAGAEILSLLLKSAIARPRPSPDLITQIGTYLVHDSFPSGHVLYYVGCFGFLFYLFYARVKHGKLRNTALIVLALLIVGIGLSRIYVGAHWFSDTLGAYLIGTAWLLIVIHTYQKYITKFHEK